MSEIIPRTPPTSPTWTVRADGWRVDILRDGEVVGSGRWTGDSVVECTVLAYPGEPEREAALHRQWARSIEAEVEAALAAAPATYNADGVDLPLIDYMLSLTPDARLTSLQNWLNDFGHFAETIRERRE